MEFLSNVVSAFNSNILVEIIRDLVGPAVILFLTYFTWRLKQTDKKADTAVKVGQEVKADIRNSHPVSLRTELDSRFDSLDDRMDRQDDRLQHIEDHQVVHELQMGAITTVLRATKNALDEGFKGDPTDS